MKKLLHAAVATALTAMAAHAQSYSNAVTALNPIGYWPLTETTPPPAAYVATNLGSLGATGNAYYDNAYPDSLGSYPYTLFGGPAPGVTSDGDTAASFNPTAAGGDPSGYMVIPHSTSALTTSGAFTAEAWVQPGGGDPNDTSGSSYSSTVWTSIIKEGYGGWVWGDNGDANGNGYGWSVSLSGIYGTGYPVGWYTPGPVQLLTNATWIVDFFSGNNGGNPSMEFDVPMYEPTPEWFHLVLTYDGTNASFYTNGVLAATTIPGTLASTNHVWGPNQSPFTTPTGAYAFTPKSGVSFAPDTVNPIVLGNINVSGNYYDYGYPQDNAIGFNNQTYSGLMDEVAIYTNALTPVAVAKHYADATAGSTTLYTNDVLSANPIVYLRLDEPAYSQPDPSTFPPATDLGSMGSSADGVYQPGVVVGASGPAYAGFGSSDFAAQFNGLDSAVDVPNLFGTPLDPTGNTPFSLSYWFKGPADSYARFQGSVGRGDNGWRSSMDGSGRIRWNPGAGPELASQFCNDGAWHHFVGVSDGSTAYLYLDGVLSVSAGSVGSLNGSSYDLIIGGAPDYTESKPNSSTERYFQGSVSQVAFFGAALTAAQVTALYNAASLPPSFITEPPATTVIVGGANATVTTSLKGSPTLGYQWYVNGVKAVNSANLSGATTNVLTFTSALAGQSGSYTLVVTNAYGAVTSSVDVVTVRSSPTIVTQPSPAVTTLYAGNSFTYTVGATGASPLAYQWYKNSSLVSGATSSNYTAVALAGTNIYTVTVSNSLGTATSSNLTVIGVVFTPPVGGFVVNYNDPGNGVYHGLGVYADLPSNTNWNLFPLPPGGTTGLSQSSSGASNLVTLSMVYGFDNGASQAGFQGSPCFLVEQEAGVNSGNPGAGTMDNPMGTFTFNDVPPGYYTLYVYAANYDGNRGSIINLAPANGGAADGGTNATLNVQSDHSCDSMVEGDNYVFFHVVQPDATGTISGNYIANPNGVLTGEGQINALQLVLDSATITKASATSVTISWAGASLQSAPSATGPWTTVVGASPQTFTTSGGMQFFRVY